ncbi:MAG: Brp/Blh family beta-carotene 15,15'-dioxygenase [bacterium]|nr:Brp/Blh family beta-carotene 15,15'-dioxygenase [bacterium]
MLALSAAVLLSLSQTAPGVELALVTGAIALAGLPHGAADAWIAAREGLASDRLGKAVFLAVYSGLALLVIAVWLLFPVMSLALFLAISVWHFGDDSRKDLHPVARISTGLIILGAPAAFHATAVSDAYGILSGDRISAIVSAQGALFWLGCVALPLTLVLTSARNPLAARATPGRINHLIEMILLVALAAFLSPLLYFAVYFCGVHSPRHLGRVIRLFPERGGSRLWGTITALTLFSVFAGAVAWGWLTTTGQQPDAAGLQVLFIGLAALTLPHMLLVDGLSPSLVRGRNP